MLHIPILKATRVDDEQEQVGLDLSLHEEKAYNLS